MCLSATSTSAVRPSRNKGREQLKRNRRPEKLTFLSQNLRSFRKDEKREELLFALREQERKWFAVCLQEVGQKEMREIECDDATMWLAKGRPNKNGKGGDNIGLGMVLCRDAMQAWKDGGGRRKMDYPSERIMDCRLLVQDCSGKEVGIHLVNAHAPVGGNSSNEWDDFFADLEASIASAATRDIVVIGGDFNSSIGVDPTTTPRTQKNHPSSW